MFRSIVRYIVDPRPAAAALVVVAIAAAGRAPAAELSPEQLVAIRCRTVSGRTLAVVQRSNRGFHLRTVQTPESGASTARLPAPGPAPWQDRPADAPRVLHDDIRVELRLLSPEPMLLDVTTLGGELLLSLAQTVAADSVHESARGTLFYRRDGHRYSPTVNCELDVDQYP